MHVDAKVTGEALFRAGNATVTGDVSIGKQVGIWFGAVVRADKDRITIGDRSNIQDNCVVHTSKGFPVTLGRDVSVGHGAILHGSGKGPLSGLVRLSAKTQIYRKVRLLSGSRAGSSSRRMQPSSSRS
jgi:UDP-3-O-[3-hydroxymyristoyl] glucosamine N-acyltransferase